MTVPGVDAGGEDGRNTSTDAADAGGGPDVGYDSSLTDVAEEAALGCWSSSDGASDLSDAATICPIEPPSAGSPCSVPSYFCEYGDNWWSRCDLIMTCIQGHWQVYDAGPGACPALDARARPSRASMPRELASALQARAPVVRSRR